MCCWPLLPLAPLVQVLALLALLALLAHLLRALRALPQAAAGGGALPSHVMMPAKFTPRGGALPPHVMSMLRLPCSRRAGLLHSEKPHAAGLVASRAPRDGAGEHARQHAVPTPLPVLTGTSRIPSGQLG